MKPVIHFENHHAIVYDADLIPEPNLRLFEPAYWQRESAVTGRAAGRGNTLLLESSFGPAVLRPYLRGGWPAMISHDRYFFSGFSRSRPFREFAILRQLAELDLPAPAPLAALCVRGGITYSGALLMKQIMNVTPLSDFLGNTDSESPVWQGSGACISRFHQAGVHHADLNANNLLFDPQAGKAFLVDFDRCTIKPGSKVNGKSNLGRLRRSLVKLWPNDAVVDLDDCWKALLEGYRG